MKTILVIAKRDFKSIVFTPMFFLIASLCTFLWGFSYIKSLINFAYSSSAPQVLDAVRLTVHQVVVVGHISLVNIVFIFIVPALTMKLISEEKRNRTYDLLLTSPITSHQIVFGKYIAGVVSSFVLVFISFLYPLVTASFAEIDLSLLLSSYLGLVLIVFAYVAVGLLSSSLSTSMVLSVIMGIVFNLSLWFLSQGPGYSESDLYVTLMEHLSVADHLYSFLRGVLNISSVVFFLSISVFFLFLSERVIESSRWR